MECLLIVRRIGYSFSDTGFQALLYFLLGLISRKCIIQQPEINSYDWLAGNY